MTRITRRRRRVWPGLLLDSLVVGLLAFALVAWHFDLGTRWGIAPDPRTEPAEVAAPAGLSLPEVRPAAAVAKPQTGSSASPAKVRAAVDSLLADAKLGTHVRALVTDLDSGTTLLDHGTGDVTPASTNKLLTAAAALHSLGPSTRFETTVVRVPGTRRVVLVGGGDPFLASTSGGKDSYPKRASVKALAHRTADALKAAGVTQVRLGYDDSLFSGPAFNPHWPSDYFPTVVPSITSLWVDEAMPKGQYTYVSDPSLNAAQIFATDLAGFGVRTIGTPVHGKAPSGAQQVAAVSSAPLGQIVARLLLVSDNNAAEVVARHVGIKEGDGGSFTGAVKGVHTVLGQLGIGLDGAVLYDGSGLSREDRLRPETLMAVVRTISSAQHPELREALTGLPVAGFSGSLLWRFDHDPPAARGRVYAKTGTLTGVHALAGVATDLDGDVLGFVLVVDKVAAANEGYAQAKLDAVAAALGSCQCRS
ncbi:D-alanyl-D-alanine carboxypeptidase/D-alanyl-D-alanine endopeptidase [Nocardioides mangrovicus]|uniref:D-alanyl-D-alanine carboxypeptidase/D-alanyl-D-alanine endopeptidase n=1 Tax=Nocardioides mangrovicus TaxID=2478913 RepID=UPI0013142A73|nr:D-alanyl-D-alanine carboxypeptidase/D-alanyl-D-alanine-endopeptidase [Nocardioides mangrovicus]